MKLKTFIWAYFIITLFNFNKVVEAKTLVLQMEVSHSRNRDQTTLIFRKNTVDFVTNSFQVSSSQVPSPRLGRFTAPLNKNLKLFKRKVEAYKKLIVSKNKKSPLSKGLKSKRRMASTRSPHTPVIRLGGDDSELEIEEGHTYFRPLRDILYQAERQRWTCVSCAEYKRKGETIIRITKNKNRKPISQTFSLQSLQCFPLSQKRIECVDVQFGIFEI